MSEPSAELLSSGSHILEGAAGPMEIIVDAPMAAEVCGIAIVAHPQPLLGGNAMHKITHLLARALCDAGWLAVRLNFRGVGRSGGIHDEGIGETQDLLLLYQQLSTAHPGARMALVGFSFGAFVQARVACELAARGETPWRICLAGMPSGQVEGGRQYATPTELPEALIVHGERDERVPLSAVLDWARHQARPVTVVPGADHFFTGKLPILRKLVLSHLSV